MTRTKIAQTLKEDGLSGVVRRVHAGLIFRYHETFNSRFDTTHAIDTRTSVALETLDFEHQHKAHAIDYEPTPIKLVEALLKPSRARASSTTFLDLGCGKGRVLIKAAELGFDRLIGVEFAGEIAEAARYNLGQVFRSSPGISWTIISQDAATYSPPESDLIVFLYNPFTQPVMEGVVNWIEAHIDRGYRVEVIYYNSQCRSLFDDCNRLKVTPFPWLVKLQLRFLSWHAAVKYLSVAGDRDESYRGTGRQV